MGSLTDMEANAIYTRSLEITRRAIFARDFDAFSSQMAVPQSIVTPLGKTHVTSKEQQSQIFQQILAAYDAQGLTDLHRYCDAASFQTPNRIAATHVTRMEINGELMDNSYPVFAVMERIDGRWQVTENEYAIDPEGSQAKALFHDQGRLAAQADLIRLNEFQELLDRVSNCFITGDFRVWADQIALPLTLHTRKGVDTFADLKSLERDFMLYLDEFRIHGVSDIVRQAKSAKLVSPDRMIGSYSTYVLRGAAPIVEPWDSSMTLKKQDGRWRISTVTHAIGHLNWSPKPAAERIEFEDKPTRGDKI